MNFLFVADDSEGDVSVCVCRIVRVSLDLLLGIIIISFVERVFLVASSSVSWT